MAEFLRSKQIIMAPATWRQPYGNDVGLDICFPANMPESPDLTGKNRQISRQVAFLPERRCVEFGMLRITQQDSSGWRQSLLLHR